MLSEKNVKFFIYFYFFLISFLSIYFLMGVNTVVTYNAMSEWVINYQGGFVRRGLIGELVFQISNSFNLDLRFCFLVLQSSLYIFYYYLIFNLIKYIKLNFIVLLTIFSPLFIIFPIAELEAIGRKEIIIFLVLLVSINLYFKYKNNDLLIFFVSIFYPIILLTFEASIFYSFFFISLIFITRKKINLSFLFRLFLLSIPSLLCIYFIYFYPHQSDDTYKMCEELKKIGEECGLATIFLSKKVGFHIAEVGWELTHILRYIWIFFLGFFPIIYLATRTKFNEKYINEFFLKTPFVLHLIVLIIPTLIIFLIAVDSGRWIHMAYSCTFIYYFGLVKNQALIINKDLFKIKFNNENLTKYIKIILFILLTLSWNPKAVYHEDLGSFPLYRAIEKMPNFYDNILKIRIFR